MSCWRARAMIIALSKAASSDKQRTWITARRRSVRRRTTNSYDLYVDLYTDNICWRRLSMTNSAQASLRVRRALSVERTAATRAEHATRWSDDLNQSVSRFRTTSGIVPFHKVNPLAKFYQRKHNPNTVCQGYRIQVAPDHCTPWSDVWLPYVSDTIHQEYLIEISTSFSHKLVSCRHSRIREKNSGLPNWVTVKS